MRHTEATKAKMRSALCDALQPLLIVKKEEARAAMDHLTKKYGEVVVSG